MVFSRIIRGAMGLPQSLLHATHGSCLAWHHCAAGKGGAGEREGLHVTGKIGIRDAAERGHSGAGRYTKSTWPSDLLNHLSLSPLVPLQHSWRVGGMRGHPGAGRT